jgi:SAM-dependent methyltransferase
MNWMLKLAVQNAVGLTPLTARLYTRFNIDLVKTRMGEPGKWSQWFREHVILIQRYGSMPVRGSCGWCLDSGFTIAAPLLFALAGARGIFTGRRFFISRAYNDVSFDVVEQNLGRLRKMLRCSKEDERAILALRGVRETGELLNRLGIRYLDQSPPPLKIADDSMDFVISMGALEHYDPEQLRQLFSEMVRVVRPGGVLSHIVDHRDHFYHAQASIGPLHHLRYSDRTWKILGRPPFSYTNRMLRSDYLQLFSGLPLRLAYAGWDPHGDFKIDQTMLDARFRGRDADDYRALVSHFICVVEK